MNDRISSRLRPSRTAASSHRSNPSQPVKRLWEIRIHHTAYRKKKMRGVFEGKWQKILGARWRMIALPAPRPPTIMVRLLSSSSPPSALLIANSPRVAPSRIRTWICRFQGRQPAK
ncbi:hypothetical protein WCLP8_3050003 [uncultured Gammaproteobacteria bacterium]